MRARLAEARAQAHEPGALGAQVGLQALELGALVGEVDLDQVLARAERRDPALQLADARLVAGDLRAEHALGALLAADLLARGIDPPLERLELLLLGGLAGGAEWQDRPEDERQRHGCEKDADAHRRLSLGSPCSGSQD